MAQFQIRDNSVWTKHIFGDGALQAKLAAWPPGSRVVLRVDGVRYEFEKMPNGPDGPMPGFKPLGKTKETWKRLYPGRRGELVDFALVEDGESGPPPVMTAARQQSASWNTATDAEREAAWDAFKGLTRAGWRSEGTAEGADRDDLHQR
jgi:hypothetical protein